MNGKSIHKLFKAPFHVWNSIAAFMEMLLNIHSTKIV